MTLGMLELYIFSGYLDPLVANAQVGEYSNQVDWGKEIGGCEGETDEKCGEEDEGYEIIAQDPESDEMGFQG